MSNTIRQIDPMDEKAKSACISIYNRAMEQALGQAHWDLNDQGWVEMFDDAKWSRLLLSENETGALAGFAVASCYRKGQAIVQLLAVDPDCQSAGVGKALLGDCARLAESMGCDRLRAYVKAQARQTQGFYRSQKGRIDYASRELDAYGELAHPVDFDPSALARRRAVAKSNDELGGRQGKLIQAASPRKPS